MGTKEEDRYLCGPRVQAQMDPQKQPYKVIRAAITNVQLTREGGTYLIVSPHRSALGETNNPRINAALPTADGSQGLAPRNGRACESGLLVSKEQNKRTKSSSSPSNCEHSCGHRSSFSDSQNPITRVQPVNLSRERCGTGNIWTNRKKRVTPSVTIT